MQSFLKQSYERKDLPLALQAARRFASAILRPVDGLAIYGFSEVVNEVVPFTSDLKRIDPGIDRFRLARRLRFTTRSVWGRKRWLGGEEER